MLPSQGNPGFQGPTGPRGPPGDGLPGEKVLERQTLTDCVICQDG